MSGPGLAVPTPLGDRRAGLRPRTKRGGSLARRAPHHDRDFRVMETRSLGAALDVTNLLIESRTKRCHDASVGLKDDQEAILGFGIEDEIAAAIT
jgi:hypothetical protein